MGWCLLPPPRSPRSPIHVVVAISCDLAGCALSARRRGPSSSSVIASRCLPTHLPPAPRSSVRLVVSFASPLLRFSMVYNILNLLLLLGFCLFCSVLVFVVNFVWGFAVQLASISTKLPSSVAYVGSQLVSPKNGNFLHVFFHLHHLLGYFRRH